MRRYPGLNLGHTDASSHEAAEEIVFGFWVFMVSDLVLFSLLFATYADMSRHGVAGGPTPQELFSLPSIFIETMLLLTSSFTFGMASLALKYRKTFHHLMFWLMVTFVLGAGFVGTEVHDFYTMVTYDHAPAQRSGFLSAFYLLVATHGVHVTAGLIWIALMLVQIRVLGLVREVKLRIMRLALFWHLLDVIWICIFTFVFLSGVVR